MPLGIWLFGRIEFIPFQRTKLTWGFPWRSPFTLAPVSPPTGRAGADPLNLARRVGQELPAELCGLDLQLSAHVLYEAPAPEHCE